MNDAAPAERRLSAEAAFCGAIALFAPWLLATAGYPPSAVVLAAVAMAVAAVVATIHRRRRMLVVPMQVRRPPASDDVPALLSGRVTDTAHHPLRPRAPGLA